MEHGTGIQWTHIPGYKGRKLFHVVSRYKVAWAIKTIKPAKLFSAMATTLNKRVRLPRFSLIFSDSMQNCVMKSAFGNLQISGPIVGFISILMMDLFAVFEIPPKFFVHHETVFIHIPATVCKWMACGFHENVAIAGNRSSTLPVWVLGFRELTFLGSHEDRIA